MGLDCYFAVRRHRRRRRRLQFYLSNQGKRARLSRTFFRLVRLTVASGLLSSLRNPAVILPSVDERVSSRFIFPRKLLD